MNRSPWLKTTLAALAVGTALAACSKEEKPESPAAEPSAAPPVELTDAVLDQTEVAVKEDFEDEAFAAIDEDTLESQVDALEKEITSEAE